MEQTHGATYILCIVYKNAKTFVPCVKAGSRWRRFSSNSIHLVFFLTIYRQTFTLPQLNQFATRKSNEMLVEKNPSRLKIQIELN